MTVQKAFDAILFDLDDTLYNSTLMSQTARMNAIRALREAGLDINRQEAFEHLIEIVKKYGSNYQYHFDRMMEELGLEPHPKLIAAALVAYHRTKVSLLQPFPDVVLTLLTLMKNYQIGIVTNGRKRKQWEKLFYLRLQHFFDVVIINEEEADMKPSDVGFKKAMKKLQLMDPTRIIYVGDKIDKDVVGANRIKMTSVLFDHEGVVNLEDLEGEKKPNYKIKRISEILEIIK